MKKIALSLSIMCAFFPLKAEEALDTIKQLIATTEKSLDEQRSLLSLVEAFYQARALFVADSDDQKAAVTLVRAAMRVHRELENEHLSHLFSSEFLEEIRFFNQVGDRARRATPKQPEAVGLQLRQSTGID